MGGDEPVDDLFRFRSPRAAVVAEPSHDAGQPRACGGAETWYYPLPFNGPMAMAINFEEDYASCVEFFQRPYLVGE